MDDFRRKVCDRAFPQSANIFFKINMISNDAETIKLESGVRIYGYNCKKNTLKTAGQI